MSSDKVVTSSLINASTNDNVNNFIAEVSGIIIDKLITGTINKEDTMTLRHMLNRIQNDAVLLKDIRSFITSFSNLDASWNRASSNYNAALSLKLANILMSLM